MTLQKCYQKIGNYEEAKNRLFKDERIQKYLQMFLKDLSFSSFLDAVQNQNYTDAFLHIHTLKGLYLNLSLSHAAEYASLLCEALRQGEPKEDISPLIDNLTVRHHEILDAIRELS